MLVTLANQNPELVQQKLPEIKLELGNSNVSQEQMTDRAKFYELLNNVSDEKVNKLFKEISGLNIEETWREQKEFVLLKQIYVAATTYGENGNACTQGTWSQIINSVSEINLEMINQYTQHLDREKDQERQRDGITKENVMPFVEDLAGKLIQYVEDNPELKGVLEEFAVAMVDVENPKEITLEHQKILATINQWFIENIKGFLPNYGRNIPKQNEYKIIIEKLPEVKVMQDFAQGKSVNNNQVTEQPNKTTSIQIEEESNDQSQPLTQSSIASSDDIRNQIQEENDEQRIGVQSAYNGLSGSTQTKFKSTSSKTYAIGIVCGMVIGVAGATALTPAIAVAVFIAVVGALVGYGIEKLCEKVSEEKQKNHNTSTCAAVKSVLFGASATECSKTLQV